MNVSRDVLKDVNDCLTEAIDAIKKAPETSCKSVVDFVLNKVKQGSEILTDYIDQNVE